MTANKTLVALAIAMLALLAGGGLAPFASNSLASGKTQYKVVRMSGDTQGIQQVLDKWSSDGWELAAVEPTIGHLIFKK